MQRTPQTMTGAVVYLEGVGFLGTTKEVELPKLEFTTWTSNAGLGEREIDTGMLKALSATLTFEEYNRIYFGALSRRWHEKTSLYIKQNVSEGLRQIPVVVTLKGQIKSLTPSKTETGKEVNVSLEMAVKFYKFEYDRQTQFLIDMDNLIFEIDGRDKYAEIKANLM